MRLSYARDNKVMNNKQYEGLLGGRLPALSAVGVLVVQTVRRIENKKKGSGLAPTLLQSLHRELPDGLQRSMALESGEQRHGLVVMLNLFSPRHCFYGARCHCAPFFKKSHGNADGADCADH